MVLVGNGNDRNSGFVGGSRVEEVFRQSSDISPTRAAGGNGGTEQWWVGHHRRLRWSRPMIVLQKEHDQARTMTIPNKHSCLLVVENQGTAHILIFFTIWVAEKRGNLAKGVWGNGTRQWLMAFDNLSNGTFTVPTSCPYPLQPGC